MRRSPMPPPAGQQVSKKFPLWLDEPLDWNLKVRRLRLSGWCVAKDGAPRTRVRGQIESGDILWSIRSRPTGRRPILERSGGAALVRVRR